MKYKEDPDLIYIYKITKIVHAFWPMVYCAGKLIENLKLLYESNRPHFLWVYWHDNTLVMLGEHSKCLWLVIYKLFSCSPNIPCGLSHR